MNTGWICPRCNASNAPFIRECKCSKKSKNTDTVYAIKVPTLKELQEIDTSILNNIDMIVGVTEESKYYKLNSNRKWTHYTPSSNVVILTK